MTQDLTILHVSTHGRHGGAGQAAWRLHTAMRAIGAQSNMLCLDHGETAPGLIAIPAPVNHGAARAAAFRELFVTRNRTLVSNSFFSAELDGVDLNQHPAVQAADIIHLHWVSGLVRPPHLAQLLASGKTVVWTLHDMAPFTGGCHYSAGCQGFLAGCRTCPQLRALSSTLPAAQLADKLSLWKNGRLSLIALNSWMAGLARQSPVLKNREVTIIPNGIDLDRFNPDKRAAQRQAWGVSPEATVLLFAADSLGEIRKGAAVLADALSLLAKSDRIRNEVAEGRLVFLAAGHGQFPETGLPVKSLGWSEEEQMAAYYAGADLFVLPSQEDNQPNTVVETFAAGTPVLAFAVGGVPELIQEGRTGHAISEFSAAALAKSLQEKLTKPAELAAMRSSCREWAEKYFDATANVQTVLAHYQRVFTPVPKTRPDNFGDLPGPALGDFLATPQTEILGLSPAEFLEQAINLADKTEVEQHAATSLKQAAFIATLQLERDRLMGETEQAKAEASRAVQASQRHIDALTAQLKQAATDSQTIIDALTAQLKQTEANSQKVIDGLTQQLKQAEAGSQKIIDGLTAQLETAVSEHQKNLARYRTELEQLAKTTHEQADFIAVQKKELDRLNALTSTSVTDIEHYVRVINEQTAYIKHLESQRPGNQA